VLRRLLIDPFSNQSLFLKFWKKQFEIKCSKLKKKKNEVPTKTKIVDLTVFEV
jgi:hypothetical protein